MKVKETARAYSVQKKPFTYIDYLNLPDDNLRYEVLRGDLIMVPAPSTRHQDVVLNIVEHLQRFVKDRNRGKIYLAPIDVLLSETYVLQPDILFIAKGNFEIITDKNISGTPDLVIEILSPATGYYDLVEKKEIYQEFGVKEYWIVDPMKRWVELYVSADNKFKRDQRLDKTGTLQSRVLEGFEITLEQIFRFN